MKRFLALTLLAAMMMGMLGCGAAPAEPEVTEAAVIATAVPPETKAAETEPDILEGALYLKVSAITFSVVGETDDIYLGMIPRELVTWESDDPAIVSVENGVLTANGVGTTTIRATYYDRQVQCTAACLAQTEEELLKLDKKTLGAPTRILPELDMEEPCTYFDDAAMVGDSITYVMRQYEAKNDALGNTVYLCRGGASLHAYLLGSVKVFYRGRELRLEDAVAASEVKRIYVLIGTSDIVPERENSQFIDNWGVMLEKLREKQPGLEVVLLSILPASTVSNFSDDLNAKVEDANDLLRQFAAENDCGYLDLAYYIRDHYRRMPQDYCQDAHHMNDVGNLVWMKVLRYYAQFESEGGTLS